MSRMMKRPVRRKADTFEHLVLVFLLMLATQISTGVFCSDVCCADSSCVDWSCCVCAVASNGVLTLPASHHPDFVPLGNVASARLDDRASEVVGVLDRPPKLVAAPS
jgi:hypothetical protein